MVNACAAFGPNDMFFFNSPNQWAMDGVPADLKELCTTDKVKDFSEIAFGPDGSWIAVFTRGSGWSIRRDGLPQGLENFLVSGTSVCPKRDLTSITISLGPNSSWFAFDDKGAQWANLPAGLLTAIKGKMNAQGNFKPGEYPQSVALGPDDAYVMTTTGGGCCWNLNGKNDTLNNYLHGMKNLKGVAVILDPTVATRFLVINASGDVWGTYTSKATEAVKAFSADWKAAMNALRTSATASRSVTQQRGQRSSGITSRDIKNGLNIAKSVLNIAAALGGGGGGGGGANTDTTFVDTSNTFWQPIQSAASDPIQ